MAKDQLPPLNIEPETPAPPVAPVVKYDGPEYLRVLVHIIPEQRTHNGAHRVLPEGTQAFAEAPKQYAAGKFYKAGRFLRWLYMQPGEIGKTVEAYLGDPTALETELLPEDDA